MEHPLVSELKRFIAEMERKEAAAVYAVPDEVIRRVRKAKPHERFLHEIFVQAGGSGGIRLESAIRREFGIPAELMDRFRRWAPYSKEKMEDALHEAVDRVEIKAGNQGVFFAGTPGKAEAAEALRLLKELAHAAVNCQFRIEPFDAEPEPYVAMLDNLLQFVSLPNTYPEGNDVTFRNLIAEDRLAAMSKGSTPVAEALKAWARNWYRQSTHTFLQHAEGYFSYDYVRNYLYILTGEQLEELRGDYLMQIRGEFERLKAKPDLARATELLDKLETVMGWTPERQETC